MVIKQFEDKELSHFSYAVLSERESKIVLIDPARDIAPYLNFAQAHQAEISAVIETHPHADFISSHLELHQQWGATIYCSRHLAADYPHEFFDEGDSLELGEIRLKALNTPGHSPDSISIVLEHEGRNKALFSGDTLFIGDCGRPDLRENTGNLRAKREELALQMYHSLRDKLMKLENDVLLYPAHGAGTLCGKSLSEASSSTMGREKENNWALQDMPREIFVKELTEEQPFIPRYFAFDVALNKKGAAGLQEAIGRIKTGSPVNTAEDARRLDRNIKIVDTRSSVKFKEKHLANSVNIMQEGKFETWLGSILPPEEPFYLAADSPEMIDTLLKRIARIGYESFTEEAFVLNYGEKESAKIDPEDFKSHPADYTIIDVRNEKEAREKPVFPSALNIPLPQLRERMAEIPADKPIVVHCAGGYRSAAGSSIIENIIDNVAVYDLGTAINNFQV